MGWGAAVPVFFVLLSLLLIVIFAVLKIKLQFDEYVPLKVAIMGDGEDRKVLVETKKKRLELKVRDFRRASSKDVLEVRINGLSLGKYRLGLYKGPYGYVESYATSDSGVLIEDESGRKYFVAFKNSEELLDSLKERRAGRSPSTRSEV